MKSYEKFFVCPNCKSPLFRKSAFKTGAIPDNNYCGKCGVKIANAKQKALAKMKKLS